jgi:hypothetical protein
MQFYSQHLLQNIISHLPHLGLYKQEINSASLLAPLSDEERGREVFKLVSGIP